MKFSVFQISRKGGRQKNEDRMGYCYSRMAGIFLLADGMGGHPEGEVAAQLALQTIAAMFQKKATPTLEDPAEFLTHALMTAHHSILRYATSKGLPDAPRTTLVAVVVQKGTAHWIHCGDSRLYMIRKGIMLTRTRDHSFVEQHRMHQVSMENINRNVLFTCLGSPTQPIFDLAGPVPLQKGDRFMLCSDGLWGKLTDEYITQTLTDQPITEAIPELVEQALRLGGERCDNVTTIAMEWENPESFPDDAEADEEDTGVFASTIHSDPSGMAPDGLDEADIERSIAEINDTIRRSTVRKA